jgi:hypothetical protein
VTHYWGSLHFLRKFDSEQFERGDELEFDKAATQSVVIPRHASCRGIPLFLGSAKERFLALLGMTAPGNFLRRLLGLRHAPTFFQEIRF